MSASFGVRLQSRGASLAIHRLTDELSKNKMDTLVRSELQVSKEKLVRLTPKGFTGNTRRAWVIERSSAGFILRNTYKDGLIMKFLEQGTRAHGPRVKKFLYIPLNARAAASGWHQGQVYGVDYVLAKWVRGIRAMHIISKETDNLRERVVRKIKGTVKRKK